MDSKIQTIAPYYSKFENILPYELIHSEITEEKNNLSCLTKPIL